MFEFGSIMPKYSDLTYEITKINEWGEISI